MRSRGDVYQARDQASRPARILSNYMSASEITIGVSLDIADGNATVWGCDLTDGYIRINADYTT